MLTFEPGIYDISNEMYHASAGISRSGISEFRKSPKNYWDKYLNPNKPKEKCTDWLTIGQALHTLLIEPEKFESTFSLAPTVKKTSKEGQQAWNKFTEELAGRQIIKKKQLDLAKEIAQAVMDEPIAKDLIKDGLYEKSIYWVDEETQLVCKCRPDILHPNFIVDIKTTISVEPTRFSYSVDEYDYHIQAAMMLDGVKAVTGQDHNNFIFLSVEKERPYCVGIYPLDEEDILLGRTEYKHYLKKMRYCFDKNQWQGTKSKTIQLSNYARNRRIEQCQQI